MEELQEVKAVCNVRKNCSKPANYCKRIQTAEIIIKNQIKYINFRGSSEHNNIITTALLNPFMLRLFHLIFTCIRCFGLIENC